MVKWDRKHILSDFKITPIFGKNWYTEYYNNVEMRDLPVYSEQFLSGINVNWGTGSPNPAVTTDYFSARFSSVQVFNEGYYEFLISSEAGVRVFIDNELVWDQFVVRPFTNDSFFHLMTLGNHDLKIEYFAGDGLAAIQFSWYQFPADFPPQLEIEKSPNKVFISYSRTDWDAFVKQIVEKLTRQGIDTWIDQNLIEGGDDWLDAINSALEECNVMVLCVSPRSLESKYVKMEYRYFIDENKIIIPILLEKTKFPAELRRLHWLPYSSHAELIARLKKLMNS